MTKAIAVIKDGWQVAWVDEHGIGSNPTACGAFQVVCEPYIEDILKALYEAIQMCKDDDMYSYKKTWDIGNGRYSVHKTDYKAISISVTNHRILMPMVTLHVAQAVYKASKKAFDKWVSADED